MTSSRSLFAAASLRMRRLVIRSVALIALSVASTVAQIVEFSIQAPLPVGDVTTAVGVGSSLALIRAGVVMRRVRLTEAAKQDAERARLAELRKLKVADPEPGQRPVCGVADLEQRRLLNVPGVPYVVPYGEHEAHYECAEVAPAEPWHLTRRQGGTVELPGSYSREQVAAYIREYNEGAGNPIEGPGPLVHSLGLSQCPCPRCRPALEREEDIGAQAILEAFGVPAHDRRGAVDPPKTAFASCQHCERMWETTEAQASDLLIEHGRVCPQRLGIKVGSAPPLGWYRIGTLTDAYDPATWENTPHAYGRGVTVRLGHSPHVLNQQLAHAVLLFVRDGAVLEFARSGTVWNGDGEDTVRPALTHRLRLAHPAGTEVWVSADPWLGHATTPPPNVAAKVSRPAQPGAQTLAVTRPLQRGNYAITLPGGFLLAVSVVNCYGSVTDWTLVLSGPLPGFVGEGALVATADLPPFPPVPELAPFTPDPRLTSRHRE